MKKLIILLSIAAGAYACGGDKSIPPEDKKADATANPDYDKGLELIGKQDCFTCHKIDEKLTGPSYKEVAEKYANDPKAVDYLAEKIVSGGSGVWGTVPMAAHAGMSIDDAKTMAKYILLLKK